MEWIFVKGILEENSVIFRLHDDAGVEHTALHGSD